MENKLYEGSCIGGPLNGTVGQSRFPKGFLLVDKPNNKVWVYDYQNGEFTVRHPEGEKLNSDPTATHNRFRAAEERSYDIRAYEEGEV